MLFISKKGLICIPWSYNVSILLSLLWYWWNFLTCCENVYFMAYQIWLLLFSLIQDSVWPEKILQPIQLIHFLDLFVHHIKTFRYSADVYESFYIVSVLFWFFVLNLYFVGISSLSARQAKKMNENFTCWIP